jgi:hypothetical protein
MHMLVIMVVVVPPPPPPPPPVVVVVVVATVVLVQRFRLRAHTVWGRPFRVQPTGSACAVDITMRHPLLPDHAGANLHWTLSNTPYVHSLVTPS